MGDLRASCGFSALEDPAEAVREAVTAATKALGVPVGLALVTMTVDYNAQTIWNALREVLGNVPMQAVTTCLGPLASTGVVTGRAGSLGVQLFGSVSGAVRFGSASSAIEAKAFDAGVQVAQRLAAMHTERPRLIWLASSPGDEESVMEGLASVLPGVPVFGGSAADNAIDGSWKVFTENGPVTSGVTVAALWGSFQMGASLYAPYEPTGTSAVLTGSEGRRLLTLDNKPAATQLRSWMGESVDMQCEEGGNILVQTSLSPLGVLRNTSSGPFYMLMHPAMVNQPAGSVDVFARTEPGATVCLMRGDTETLIAVSDKVLDEALRVGELEISSVRAAMLIYCAGCAGAVGPGIDKALAKLKHRLGDIPLMGRCTFGEQGFVAGLGNVHTNLSVALVLLS